MVSIMWGGIGSHSRLELSTKQTFSIGTAETELRTSMKQARNELGDGGLRTGVSKPNDVWTPDASRYTTENRDRNEVIRHARATVSIVWVACF